MVQKEKKSVKPTLPLVNAGLPDRVSALSTKCGGCHPKRLIVASLYKINNNKNVISLKFKSLKFKTD